MEGFLPAADEAQIKKEKERARKLRQSRWWKEIRARGVCHFCGGNFPPAELTMEHLIPLVRGGRSEKNNIVAACKDCNNRKKHMLPWEWEEYLRGSTGGAPLDDEDLL